MFDLEKSIATWKKSLKKHERFEDGLIADLELHFRDVLEAQKKEGLSDEDAFRAAEARVGTAESIALEYQKNQILRRDRESPRRLARFMPALPWHYLKVGLRNIKRQMSYSVINIVGLSVGLACFLLISAFIQFETSFDRFHEKSDRTYRLAIRENASVDSEYSPRAPEILARTLTANIPEIETAGIILRSRNALLQSGQNRFKENGQFADVNFFRIFSFDLLRGNRSTVLAAPNAIVLGDRLAEKLFGREDPIGKIIKYTGGLMTGELSVTGVAKRPPQNSHLQFEYLVSASTLAAKADTASWFDNWNTFVFQTYVTLKDRRSSSAVEPKIEAVFRENRKLENSPKTSVYLQPMTDIHLKSRVAGETATNNRIQSVYLLASIALIILLIAGINAMNLSTARASTRAKEICIRKVVGGKRAQLIRQFIGESYLFSGLSMVLALFLFFALFPLFTGFLGAELTLAEVNAVPLALSVLGAYVFIGAFSGIYPAVVLSGFQPYALLKKQPGARRKRVGIRNLLVIVQFAAAVVLLIGILVIAKQMSYIRQTLGFDKDNVVMVSLGDETTKSLAGILKTRLQASSKVLGVTVADSDPLVFATSYGGSPVKNENGDPVKMDYHLAAVDEDFLRVYGLKIARGRNFSPEFATDADAILVNQAFVRRIGWTDPIGKKLMNAPVIGVVEDFHSASFQKEIEPAAFSRRKDLSGQALLGIKIRPGDPAGALAEIKKIFAQITSSPALNFNFLDDAFDALYREEQRLISMIGYLEGVAVLLGCLGLFGLATYAAQRRAKEIGIRKVLGATVFRVMRMMSGEFLILIFVANVVAWPIGQYIMRKWLQAYAYRCSIGIGAFILAGLVTMLLALLVVGLQTLKASRTNPVESLRYD